MIPTLLVTVIASTVAAIPDGALLVLRNSNKPVAAVTGSDITHLALVFQEGGTEWVYEATPAKVRRISLGEYQREIGNFNQNRGRPTRISVLKPKYPYSELQVDRMRHHAASQVGRRYSVKGYVRAKEFDGVHCAHLAAETLQCSGRFQFDEAYAISPGDLVASIRPLHESPVPLAVLPDTTDESWCERSWTTWFNCGDWCRWACYETWTFCW